jgi:hypothetical protein
LALTGIGQARAALMNNIEQLLAAISVRAERQAAEGWRVERVGSARRRRVVSRSEPACSLILPLWLDRLGDRRRSTAYRIRRVATTD